MNVDLAIIGAGPAGLCAATTAAGFGLSTVVLDENPTPGGRLTGQLHEQPGKSGPERWWKGEEIARRISAEASAAGATLLCGVDVWGIFPSDSGNGWRVYMGGGRPAVVEAARVLIATGAAEHAAPIPGWQLPGAMTIGAAQVMANIHRVKPGERALVVGVDVLSLTIARELQLAGVEVVGIVLPAPSDLVGERASPATAIQSLLRLSQFAPSAWTRLVGPLFRGPLPARFAAGLYPRAGFRVWGIPVRMRTACSGVVGTDQVEGAVLVGLDRHGRILPGSEDLVEVDCVCLSGGLYPLAELAATVGCELVYIEELGGHVPLHGPEFQTTSSGIYVAGNITGIEGAAIAMAQGKAAGIALARSLGKIPSEQADSRLARAHEEINEVRQRSPVQFAAGVVDGRKRMADLWAKWRQSPVRN